MREDEPTFEEFPEMTQRDSIFSHMETEEAERVEKPWRTEIKDYLFSEMHQSLIYIFVIVGIAMFVTVEYMLEQDYSI